MCVCVSVCVHVYGAAVIWTYDMNRGTMCDTNTYTYIYNIYSLGRPVGSVPRG